MWIAATLAAAAPFCAVYSAVAQEPPDDSSVAQESPKQSIAANQTRIEADPAAAMLDAGFRCMYELNFKAARAEFSAYQKVHPEDPMGKAAEAASYLFEQLNAKGVLTSAFFLNDSKFLNGADGSPAENRNQAFLDANRVARDQAKKILKANPVDTHGLFILTMTDGMEADYDAIIQKKQMAGLSLVKQAESEANTLLALDPNAQDAYVALGAGNYIIGSLPGYKRMFLWMGGIHGDRQRGMDQLQSAASNGHYLQPFAKILLALASEREHQHERARSLLSELAIQFPANPLFSRELALLQQRPSGAR